MLDVARRLAKVILSRRAAMDMTTDGRKWAADAKALGFSLDATGRRYGRREGEGGHVRAVNIDREL